MFDRSKIDQLRDLVDNDIAELTSLVEEYEVNSTKLLGQIQEALARGSVQEVSRGAHTLKSSSALMGAAALAKQCEELEHLTRGGNMPPDTPQRVAQLVESYKAAQLWLQAQLAG